MTMKNLLPSFLLFSAPLYILLPCSTFFLIKQNQTDMASSPSSVRISMSSYSYEVRPRLLKDFLLDDSSVPSCSSHNSHFRLLRSRSKSASIPISAIHKASEAVVKAIKFFPFVKSPSLLARSISRKKTRRESDKNSVLGDHQARVSTDHQQVTPKIKDILRWKSFRDVVEELSTSWLESDFSPEDLNSFGTYDHGNDYYFMDQKNKMEGHLSYDENEQQSPVSVLNDSPFRDDHHGESVSFFNRTFATMERRKCVFMQRIVEFETLARLEPFTQEENPTAKEEEGTDSEVEAKARQLLGRVKATNSNADNVVLLDFFRHELLGNIKSKNQEGIESSEREMLEMAKSWMHREYCEGTFEREVLDNKEACVREMEAGLMKWTNNNFPEEKQALGHGLEVQVFNDLIDELWAELVSCNSTKERVVQ